MRRRTLNGLVSVVLVCGSFGQAQASDRVLTYADADLLVKNVPSVIRQPAKCVFLDNTKWSETIVMVHAYNNCDDTSASRTIGLFFVDLNTGAVYESVPDGAAIQSPGLEKARKSLLKKRTKALPKAK